MGTHFQNLYEHLKTLLANCDVFAGDETLRAVFADPRICEWQRDLPYAHSRERRIVQTIHTLHGRYNGDQENGLVLLLRVLSDRVDPDDGLADMAERVRRAIVKDSRQLLNTTLQGMEFEPVTPLPFAGQVIAGTGDVVMTCIDALTPGESYRLDVIGSSMEHEGIFEGDQVEMRAFNSFEWPGEGDMIVTKYLPYGAEPGMATDFVGAELLGPTLKIFHQKANGEFHLGWRKDNAPWTATSWKRFSAPGNEQMIVTRYLAPIGKVINVKRQRYWDFSPLTRPRIFGG